MMKINGQCHCGEIKFVANIDPEKVVVCHCTDCQIIAGSAFRTVVMSEPNAMTFTRGQPKEYIKIAESGNHRAQGFCANCGTALYATSVGQADKIYGIRLGCVKEKEQLSPKVQIWQRSAQAWLKTLSTITSFAKGPN